MVRLVPASDSPMPSPFLQEWHEDEQEALPWGLVPALFRDGLSPLWQHELASRLLSKIQLRAQQMSWTGGLTGVRKPLSLLDFFLISPANSSSHNNFLCQPRPCVPSHMLPRLVCAVWMGCHRQPKHGINPLSLHKEGAWSQQCVGNNTGCIADTTVHLTAKLVL